MAEETKHQFVDDYPYLVYAADDKAVYTADGNTPYVPGGGGSSDFTTAEVTIESNYDDGGDGYFTTLIPTTLKMDDIDTSNPYCIVDNENPRHVSVILYKGEAYAEAYYGELGSSELQAAIVEVSGNATVDYSSVYITGDCTITCTGTQTE